MWLPNPLTTLRKPTIASRFWRGGLQGGNVVPVPDPNNLKVERSESVFDIPQALQLTYTFALPFERGRQFGGGMGPVLNAFFGGWQNGCGGSIFGQISSVALPLRLVQMALKLYF